MGIATIHITNSRNTACWVYLFRNQGEVLLQIGYSLYLPELARDSRRIHLLYYKGFSNIIDGLGYKLLLEHLSKDSLRRIICDGNPRYKDLSAEIA